MLVGTPAHAPEDRRTKLAAYWLSSFAEKHVELGVVLAVLGERGSLVAAALTGLAFQAGKVVPVAVRLPPSPALAALAGVAGTTLLLLDATALSPCLAGSALIAVATNYARRWAKAGAGDVERLKNVARVCAVLSAPFFSALVTGALTIAALVVLARSVERGRLTQARLTVGVVGRLQPNHVAMWLHHAHYFSYSHAITFLFACVFEAPHASLGLVFYVGWIGYEVYDFVMIRASASRFAIGHVIAALAIAGLFSTGTPLVALVLWAVTGAGGGTFAMLSDLRSEGDGDPTWNLEIVEYYGHLMGMLLLLLMAHVASQATIGLVAALLALSAPLPLVWRRPT